MVNLLKWAARDQIQLQVWTPWGVMTYRVTQPAGIQQGLQDAVTCKGTEALFPKFLYHRLLRILTVKYTYD